MRDAGLFREPFSAIPKRADVYWTSGAFKLGSANLQKKTEGRNETSGLRLTDESV